MERLAKQQACQLMIEQEIEKGLEEGKSKSLIGREISGWIAKLFDAHIKPDSIRRRAIRAERQGVTDVTPPTKPEPEEPEWQEPPILNQAEHVAEIIRERNLKEIKGKAEKVAKESKGEEEKGDSENLSSLKKYWNYATDEDQEKFIAWIEEWRRF